MGSTMIDDVHCLMKKQIEVIPEIKDTWNSKYKKKFPNTDPRKTSNFSRILIGFLLSLDLSRKRMMIQYATVLLGKDCYTISRARGQCCLSTCFFI